MGGSSLNWMAMVVFVSLCDVNASRAGRVGLNTESCALCCLKKREKATELIIGGGGDQANFHSTAFHFLAVSSISHSTVVGIFFQKVEKATTSSSRSRRVSLMVGNGPEGE